MPILGKANRSLASLDALYHALPNPELLLSPLTTREAVLSSKIEGTQAGLEDVWRFEAGDAPEEESKNHDVREIINYRMALGQTARSLDNRPFCLNTLLSAHGVLMDSVRGHDKRRGEFRTTQNWIGPEGCEMDQAAFIPPAPQELKGHLHAWEKYWHSTDQPDPLLQLAIVHAQFEILHPFLDGNGRLGRLIIPIFLNEKQILGAPCFYLSAYLESRRDEYVRRLRELGAPGSWDRWCHFFINGIHVQAEEDKAKAVQILGLYRGLKQRFIGATRSEHAVPLLDFMFSRPIFNGTQIVDLPNMPSRAWVTAMLGKLAAAGAIKVIQKGSGRRPARYALAELVDICEGRRVF